jgi:hypothetical protein
MSSRKSRRASSSRVASKSSNDKDYLQAEMYTNDSSVNKNIRDITTKVYIVGFIISLIVQGSVLYYLYNLEDANCNCIRDWRHNFCKAYALLVLGIGVLLIAFQHLNKGLIILYHIFGLINVYAFFTYIGDLNSTQCVCAVNNQPNLNNVMRFYRWILLFVGISTFFQLLALLGIIGSSKPSTSR